MTGEVTRKTPALRPHPENARRAAEAFRRAAAALDRAAFRIGSLLRCAARRLDGPSAIECGWKAGGCEREAQHLVLIRFKDKPVPMCHRCAGIFNPALGATGAYRHEFMRRTALSARGAAA